MDDRVLRVNDRFVAFLPFASAWPYETWIMPRTPRPSFGSASDEDLDEFALLLREVLTALRRGLDDPDYNYVIHSVPASHADREYLSWYLQLTPRMTTLAGFELGTGMRVNPTSPDDATAHLLQVLGDDS